MRTRSGTAVLAGLILPMSDFFAANLLMPQDVFEELVEVYGATCDELVGYFGVSISAVRTRARLLGLGNDI